MLSVLFQFPDVFDSSALLFLFLVLDGFHMVPVSFFKLVSRDADVGFRVSVVGCCHISLVDNTLRQALSSHRAFVWYSAVACRRLVVCSRLVVRFLVLCVVLIFVLREYVIVMILFVCFLVGHAAVADAYCVAVKYSVYIYVRVGNVCQLIVRSRFC